MSRGLAIVIACAVAGAFAPAVVEQFRKGGAGSPAQPGSAPVQPAPPASGAATYRDPSGFSLNLPSGWSAKAFEGGSVTAATPDGSSFVLVSPVIGRPADCDALIRSAFASGWQTFPEAASVAPRNVGTGVFVADFPFRGGRQRGAVMCAATGPRSAMFYAMAAPAERFAGDRAQLVGMLCSFRYEQASGKNQAGAPAAVQPLPTEPWQEPTEAAYTTVKPAGWRTEGGVARLSNMDVRVGVRMMSPDGQAGFILGDVRFNKCLVPGPQTMQGQLGAGAEWCPYREGVQVAEEYAARAVASDWGIQGLQITGRRPRQDLTSQWDQQLASTGMGLGIRNAFGEVTFEGTRNGAPVSGRLVANTQFMPSVDRNLLAGTYSRYVTGFVAAKGQEPAMEATLAKVHGSVQWNVQWYMANLAAGARDGAMVRRYMAEQAQLGQRMFEDRMASADRRAAAVGDVLSGRVRLRDADGNQYEAPAGGNYYYANDQQARTHPQTAGVLGTSQWVSPNNGVVDLRPLEVIQ